MLVKKGDFKRVRIGTAIRISGKSFDERLEQLETYWHTMSRPAHGLAWYGVTLIPPRSLLPMARILKENGNPELYPLTQLLERAATEGKTVIHYGI